MKNLNEFTVNCDMRVLPDELKTESVIHVQDHMPPVIDPRISIKGENHYFKNTIIDLFKDAGVDYNNKTFVFDIYLRFEDFKNAVYTGEVFYGTAKMFKQYNTSWTLPTNVVTKNFSFISNRPREHRRLLGVALKHLIKHNNYSYSFNATNSYPLEELLIGTDYGFDVNNLIDERWITIAHDNKERIGLLNFRDLYDNLFAGSPVSLITEPFFLERGCGFTEKTFMSIYAGQFMIWPGLYKGAVTAKQYGIDVFDDVVDHSYQYIEHPGQRLVEAIKRNYTLLTQLQYASEQRERCWDRLQDNFKQAQDLDKILATILENNPAEWHEYIIKANNSHQ